MRRFLRPSRRTFTFWAAAFVLLGVSAAVFQYDRSHPNPAPSPGQILLDERLTWAVSSFSSMYPPVPGPQHTCVWERRFPTCQEIDQAGKKGERWHCEGSSSGTEGPICNSPCPVLGDGRFYIASTSELQRQLFAYDLGRPPVPVTKSIGRYTVTDFQRPAAWASDSWQSVRVSGMTYDDGKVYVGVEEDQFNGGLMALNGANGKQVSWVPFPAKAVGPPLLTRLPSGGKAFLVALHWGDGSGGVSALDAAAGRVLWTANVPFHPIGPPAEAGGIVVVGGVGKNDRPAMAAFHVPGGGPVWQFESPHHEPGADEEWAPNLFGGRKTPQGSPIALAPSRSQPGGVVAAVEQGRDGGSAYFACGRRLYAVDLMSGRPRWELAPPIDPQIVKAVNVIVDSPAPRPANALNMASGELPRAPWVTAPSVHGDEVLFGAPDGLWAVAADDGRTRWHLRQQEVGAVDEPPLVRDGMAYFAGQGWIGADFEDGREQAAYAIRLDGPAVAPTLTVPFRRPRHWPWLAAGAALAGLLVAAAGPPVRSQRWPDVLPLLFVLAAAAVLLVWAARHHPMFEPSQVGASPPFTDFVYRGMLPTAMLFAMLALAYAAALLGTWRGRKLAVAAILSLAVSAAIATLWARGRRAEDLVRVNSYDLRPDRVQHHEVSLVSAAGGLRIERMEHEQSLAAGLLEARDALPLFWCRSFGSPTYPTVGPLKPPMEQGAVRQWHGFEAQSRRRLDPADGTTVYSRSASVTVPDWSLLVPASVLPAAWLFRAGLRWRDRRRARTGRCPACNYSLTGNVSGICPECGTPTPVSPAAPLVRRVST